MVFSCLLGCLGLSRFRGLNLGSHVLVVGEFVAATANRTLTRANLFGATGRLRLLRTLDGPTRRALSNPTLHGDFRFELFHDGSDDLLGAK